MNFLQRPHVFLEGRKNFGLCVANLLAQDLEQGEYLVIILGMTEWTHGRMSPSLQPSFSIEGPSPGKLSAQPSFSLWLGFHWRNFSTFLPLLFFYDRILGFSSSNILSPEFYFLSYSTDWQTFSLKVQMVNIFSFVGNAVLVSTTQF